MQHLTHHRERRVITAGLAASGMRPWSHQSRGTAPPYELLDKGAADAKQRREGPLRAAVFVIGTEDFLAKIEGIGRHVAHTRPCLPSIQLQTAVVQEATTEANRCQSRVHKLEQRHAHLARQAAEEAATQASLTERASQAQQQAEELDEEGRVATRKADRWYKRLRSEWSAFLEDKTVYKAEKQKIETLRPDAGRLTELDKARGRLQGAEEELEHIAAEEA